MIFDDGDRYVTIRECAQLFSVSTTTIRNWVLQGKFPQSYKLGRAVRWRKKEILAFTPKKNTEQIATN
ncbi:helix-turn-helix transcriptional regulator [Bartonella rattimassiliensis]|uniref:Excisionase family DNA binding domain-containing protein n=1 Tax=Bartonella rattimassiliensis 15908 TaxID=1094556 RepID=J0Z5R7_9HYPH|nr:helix-turn-helix domain-containing protein [Bartonella rattimassiliensis]EJF82933.1 excisionase family DNA binding domain-containing protein [Bartonella rattimassiliensis 15908]